MSLIGILIIFLIIVVVLWAARALISAFSIEQPWATVIFVVLVLIVLVWALQQVGFVGRVL